MTVILSTERHYEYLSDLVLDDPPAEVLVSTFGLYAGVLEDGRRIHAARNAVCSAAGFLDAIADVPSVRVLVGVPGFNRCRKGAVCEDCSAKHVALARRTFMHARTWSEYGWRYLYEHHLKCVLARGRGGMLFGIVGGRNLSDSNWTDASIAVGGDEAGELYDEAFAAWNGARPIDDAYVAAAAEEVRAADEAPGCPSCGLLMVSRSTARGPFWGCSQFPACRGTLRA